MERHQRVTGFEAFQAEVIVSFDEVNSIAATPLFTSRSMAETQKAAVLYRDRHEWKDITPIPQSDPNVNPITPIFYNETCKCCIHILGDTFQPLMIVDD